MITPTSPVVRPLFAFAAMSLAVCGLAAEPKPVHEFDGIYGWAEDVHNRW